MDEMDWLTCPDPIPMLNYLEGRLSRRKLLLFTCGCCRRLWDVWHMPDDEWARSAVEAAERGHGAGGDEEREAAVGRVSGWELRAESVEVSPVVRMARRTAQAAAEADNADGARTTARLAQDAVAEWVRSHGHALLPSEFPEAAQMRRRDWEGWGQAALMHDLVGNPFQPRPVEPRWRDWGDGLARRLARAIYDERAFERLPLLADALEDAGCVDAAILAHCRGPGPHYRGCWVLDRLRDPPET